jgi:hypothetical protein
MDFLFDGPDDAPITLALAHGAGAPMESPFMAFFAEGLAARGLRVARFEFPYMAGRRTDGRKRGPDRPDVLLAAWREAIGKLGDPGRLVIGGKSMGGRIASLIADEAGVAGLVCLGYPFHPPRRPATLRTAHLAGLTTPTLIVQGTRDPLGSTEEVANYLLSPAIRVRWIEDGDHDLTPRKRSGRTREQNWRESVEAVTRFAMAT